MPRVPTESNSRVALRIQPGDKATIMRAAVLEHTDMTHFILKNVLPVAKAVIAQAERVELSERDSLRVLNLLENPPAPNAELMIAAHALPDLS